MKLLFIGSFTTILVSCQKLVDIPPPISSITDENVYSTDATAVSILSGLYKTMSTPSISNNIWTGIRSINISTGLSSDELFLSAVGGPNESLFFRNNLVSAISTGGRTWNIFYNLIYRCNAAIEGIQQSNTLSGPVKQQVLGEAYFMRAYNYFYLVNLYGPLPLATSTDYNINSLLSRSSISDVYALIVSDLTKAKDLLSDQFLNGSVNGISSERVRPTKWAASAFLARTYLYLGQYSKAEEEASVVINNTTLFQLLPLNSVFLKNSKEAIWQIQPTTAGWNTEDAKVFIIPTNGFNSSTNPVYLNPSLLANVEVGDQRFTNGNWASSITINGTVYRYAHKYKVNTINSTITPATGTQNMTEYLMMVRLAEVILIRAESRARQSDMSGAIADLDLIRNRAGLPKISLINPGISQSDLVNAIMRERRSELFTEGCHRWFDLKRTGTVDAVMSIESPLKGGVWDPRESLYPIPASELLYAPNLVQNPGYPTTG